MSGDNEKMIQDIRAQIRRMRGAYVEPTAVYLSDEVYSALGRPRRVCGIQAECDERAQTRWAVR